MQPANLRHLELIFPAAVSPGDMELIAPAGRDKPGQAVLLAARVERCNETCCRVYSSNGGAFIGITAEEDPWWPYNSAYWLQEDYAIYPVPPH
jgi:hypothetical protein